MNIKNIILAPALILFFTSCERVIDIEINNSEPQIVIESVIEHGQDDFQVRITRSGDYFESGPPETISNATVVLSDDKGLDIDVPYDADGYYRTQHVSEVGVEYTLTVDVEGEQYTATSVMPSIVPLQQLDIEYEEETTFNDEGYSVYSRFQDPQSPNNFYRLIHSINGIEQKSAEDLQIIDDRLYNGGLANLPIFGTTFEAGDSITIELLHIDEATFDYFESLVVTLGGGDGPAPLAAPANPTNNWEGGDVLGYFGAQTSSVMGVRLPE